MAKKISQNPFLGDLNVRILRLKNGQDIICNILSVDEVKQTIIVECPLDIDVNVINKKKYILLSPWVPLEIASENKFTLRAVDILTSIKPRVGLISRYIDLYWTVNSMIDEYEVLDNIDKPSIN